MDFLNEKIKSIKPSPTLAINDKASKLKAQGLKVISLSVGAPDFNPPDLVIKEAVRLIEAGRKEYTPVAGEISVRQKLSEKISKEQGLNYDIDEITLVSGAKEGLFLIFAATLNAGDEVIIPAPYWVSYPSQVELAGGRSVFVECPKETGFKLTPSNLERAVTPKTKWLLLNSPSNPTGAAYTKEDLKALSDVLLKHENVGIITDDIYRHIIYDGFDCKNIIQVEPKLKERSIIADGFSKDTSVPGWRIGYLAGIKEVISGVNKIKSHSSSHPSIISQLSVIPVLEEGKMDYLKCRNEIFKKRRDMVVEMLNEAEGIECLTPEGAFYVYPYCKGCLGKKTKSGKIIKDDADFASELLEQELLALVPGVAFGLSPYFRLSYATDEKVLIEACKKIQNFCKSLS